MAPAPAMTPVAHQEPPECPTENLPNEILLDIFDFIVQDDHTRSDVVSLLLVNKYFHNNLKKHVRSHVTFFSGQELHPAPEVAINLPSTLKYVTMCHHGPCAHDQHRLGLTSPNVMIDTVYILPSLVNGELRCQVSDEATCTPLPVLRPRTLAILNPGTTAEGRVHQGIVPDTVKHVVHTIGPHAIDSMGLTLHGINWYLREYHKVKKVTVFFTPLEEPERESYGIQESQQFFVHSLGIKRLFQLFRCTMLTNEDLQVVFVNVGALHSIVTRQFGAPVLPTTAERQVAVRCWFALYVARRHSELQADSILKRARFMSTEEYDEEQGAN